MAQTEAQDIHFTRLGVTVAEPLLLLVHKYLTTYSRLPDGDIQFIIPRSADADTLLCRLAMDGEDVAEELLIVMSNLFDGGVFDEGELPVGWEQQTAASLHHLDNIEDRVITYVRAYWKEACQLYGFADLENTEPPEESVVVPERTISFERTAVDWSVFERRLDEEASRGSRGLGLFSMMIVKLSEDADEEHIASRLRPYDVACKIENDLFGVILPGTDAEACTSVVVRLRRMFEEEISIGVATWPEGGVNGRALIEHAEEAASLDHRRLESGEVEFDTIPPYMVDDEETNENGIPGKAWLEGLPQAISVKSKFTNEGIRLRAPLPFLRNGSAIQFTERGRVLNGIVKTVCFGSSPDKDPVLQLEVRQGQDPPS